jgi:PAS domain S-box-containing protein
MQDERRPPAWRTRQPQHSTPLEHGPQDELEAQLQFQANLLAAVQQAVIATDVHGTVLYWNDAAAKLYGWAAEEALGANILELTPTRQQIEASAEIMERLRAGQNWSGRLLLRRKDGTTFLGHVTDSPVYDDEGELTAIVGVSYDCTEQERLLQRERTATRAAQLMAEEASAAQQSLQSLNTLAEQAVRDREDLVAVVSHDLRNPLNVLTMASSLLLEEELTEEAKAVQLRLIRRGVARMQRLIADLLDVTRLQADGVRLTLAPVGAREVIDVAVSQVLPLAERARVRIDVDVADSTPRFDADSARIVQVLDNLLGNALRYSPSDGVIRVTACADGDGVEFAVADSGPGIPPEERQHLFERFWQGQRRDGSGVGLGLAICKGIVDAHGGRIWVRDSAEGATVAFRLPLEAVQRTG